MTEWLPDISWSYEVSALARLGTAAVLGAIVGLEREQRNKPAGLRTVLLVCVGAELFTEASLWAASYELNEYTRADPARIAAQIVSGVGFLGAGAILVHRGNVVGLTTAAAIWVAAAIGMTVGLRLYALAVGATVLVMIALTAMERVERRTGPKSTNGLTVAMRGQGDARAWLESKLASAGLHHSLQRFEFDAERSTLAFRVSGNESDRDRLLDALVAEDRVESVALD